ncbi:MAG: FecR domain-containing protein [Deltaproteobacteria bacterium]|nr:FecR domain-containing protein [Deltaproteobacteria bacterium]
MWSQLRLLVLVIGAAAGISLAAVVPSVVFGAAEVTCQCLQSTCGACEIEDGVDFYSEKCGPNLSKTKSCKRPQCRPVENQKACLSRQGQSPIESQSEPLAESQESLRDRNVNVVTTTDSPIRKIASLNSNGEIPNRSAQVVLAGGRAFLIRSTGSKPAALTGDRQPIEKGTLIQINDRIVTEADGRVRLRFPELSEIFISPGSSVVIEEALLEKRSGPSKRTIMLDLHRGKVRSRVQGRYDDGESKFQVKTRAAVAGVRGTDFVISFEPGKKDWKTEVKTLSGNVCLGSDAECGRPSAAAPCGESGEKSAVICAGMYAAYVAPAPPEDASQVEIEAAMERGFMTPLFRMSEEDLRTLDRETEIRYDSFGADANSGDQHVRTISSDHATCHSPVGNFNQCAWTCEGNPKGLKSCRTDLPGVQCVRRLCRASGQWAEPTVMPSRHNGSCAGDTPVVKDCGGYW